MIHVACKDLLELDDEKLVVNLRDEMLYVCRSFGLEMSQVHQSPPGGLPIILLQPADGAHVQGEDGLVDFEHPDDCVYLFGATNEHLQLQIPVDAKIFIPHSQSWNLFASQAAAIVLYDRYVKRGGFG